MLPKTPSPGLHPGEERGEVPRRVQGHRGEQGAGEPAGQVERHTGKPGEDDLQGCPHLAEGQVGQVEEAEDERGPGQGCGLGPPAGAERAQHDPPEHGLLGEADQRCRQGDHERLSGGELAPADAHEGQDDHDDHHDRQGGQQLPLRERLELVEHPVPPRPSQERDDEHGTHGQREHGRAQGVGGGVEQVLVADPRDPHQPDHDGVGGEHHQSDAGRGFDARCGAAGRCGGHRAPTVGGRVSDGGGSIYRLDVVAANEQQDDEPDHRQDRDDDERVALARNDPGGDQREVP